jgi:hypothetical protein
VPVPPIMLPPTEVPAPPAAVVAPSMMLKPMPVPDTVPVKETSRASQGTSAKADGLMSHADDYSSLCGRVSRDFKNRNAWRLRYMSIDQTDEYGGALTFVEDDSLRGLKDGMCIKVWGRLHDADEPGGATMYFVDRFVILSK